MKPASEEFPANGLTGSMPGTPGDEKNLACGEFGCLLGLPGDDSRFVKQKRIGKGAHGEAFLVTDRTEAKPPGQKPTEFVMKVMDLPRMSHRDVRYALSEVRCLSLLNHANVVRYYADFHIEDQLLILMEYADGGDLERQVRARAFRSMSYFLEYEVFFMFLQLMLALDHVHGQKMLHRDLKTANVFVATNGVVKLGDFGYSHKYEDTVSGGVAGTFCGTPVYLAPELWKRHRYSKKADMWSLGVVLYELLALKRPYFSLQIPELMDKILHAYHVPPPPHFSDEIIEICSILLEKDPQVRPTTRQLSQNPHVKKGLGQLARMVSRNQQLDASVKGCITSHVDVLMTAEVKSVKHVTEGSLQRAVGTVKQEWEDCYLVLEADTFVVKASAEGEVLTRIRCVDITTVCPLAPQESGGSAPVWAVFLNHSPHVMSFRCKSEEMAHQWLESIMAAVETSAES
eukprot:Hpha_TRINITY_DN14054_c0_g2::TRINITY_DN14054_c0_g2_i1::g.44369::m.44369/K08857/NEK1_4_5; NIMA (never in mitosis gene a)-related kinase 1/4/5